GRGGMGVVYEARDVKLDRPVALKIVGPAHADTPQHLERFLREARAVARLDHPHVVRIYAVEEHEGRPYLALEFVPGGTLADDLRTRSPRPDEAAQLIETLARAVQHAHERGIVHRDLKPGNVLLTPERVPKVVDFGLA